MLEWGRLTRLGQCGKKRQYNAIAYYTKEMRAVTASNPTRPIQSLDRGLALLETVANARQPVSLAELTGVLGIDRSSVFRLANTLKLRGFLAQSPDTKSYMLGSAVWRLADLFPWGQVLKQLAREQVTSLVSQTGESAHVVIRVGRQAVFVDCELTTQPVGVPTCTGACESLHVTSVGKALIVDFDRKRLVELLGDGPLPTPTNRAIGSIDALARECQRTRERGYAIDDRENHEDVRCFAAPVRDSSGEVVAAIGISGPAERLPKSRWQSVARAIKHAAEEVGEKLGAQPVIALPE